MLNPEEIKRRPCGSASALHPEDVNTTIDPWVYDLPCDGRLPLEWWYYNCHLRGTPKKVEAEKKSSCCGGSDTTHQPEQQKYRTFGLFSSFFSRANGVSRLDENGRRNETKDSQTSAQTDDDKEATTPKKKSSRSEEEERRNPNPPQYACTWACVDVTESRYYQDSLLDPRSVEVFEDMLKDSQLFSPEAGKEKEKAKKEARKKKVQPFVNAFRTMLEQGKGKRLPWPNRVMQEPAQVGRTRRKGGDTSSGLPDESEHKSQSDTSLHINLDDECCVRSRRPTAAEIESQRARGKLRPEVVYELKLVNPSSQGVSAELVFIPERTITRHGQQGGSGLGIVNDMFYYYIPRMRVVGSISLPESDGGTFKVEGEGWYDREMSTSSPAPSGGMISSTSSITTTKGSSTTAASTTTTPTALSEACCGAEAHAAASRTSASDSALDGWTWLSLQLDDDTELSYYQVVDAKGNVKDCAAVYTDSQCVRRQIEDVDLRPMAVTAGKGEPSTDSTHRSWVSMVTFNEYATRYSLSVPSLGLELTVEAVFDGQEMISMIVGPGGFWEGCMTAQGSRQLLPSDESDSGASSERYTTTGERENQQQQQRSSSVAVRGKAFMELKQPTSVKSLEFERVLGRVGKFVQYNLRTEYLPSIDHVTPGSTNEHFINKHILGRYRSAPGNQIHRVIDTSFQPPWSLVDRGGKAWRSLIIIAAINCLSVNTPHINQYSAMAELMHVGSLIIDDIQDDSVVRRGGRCVHMEHGIPLALNAGTLCFFMAPLALRFLPDGQRLKCYEIYFDMMRAAHVGQGMDVAGLDYLMPDVVETGNTERLLDAVRAIHIYKTGGAAGALCRCACVITNSPDVEDAFDVFGTKLGLAFQIVDDALNLRGFTGDLKEKGEDVRDGKVTYPIVTALGKMSTKDERHELWAVLQKKTSDVDIISDFIARVEAVGAITDCLVEAREMILEAWGEMQPKLVDSLPKLQLWALCNFLCERTK